MKARKLFSILNSTSNKCALVKTKCGEFIANRKPNVIHIQGDQKVSVHLMMYCNRQVHRDFLIALYKPFQRMYSPTVFSTEYTEVRNNVTPPHV
jgi:hypothetical protein